MGRFAEAEALIPRLRRVLAPGAELPDQLLKHIKEKSKR